MINWKSSLGLLSASLAIVAGVDILKSLACWAIQSLSTHADSTQIIIAVCSVCIFSVAFLRKTKLPSFKENSVISYLLHRKEKIGLSIGISSCSFLVRSFYSSFYDFELSLTCMFTAFGLALASLIVIFGKNRVPSSTVVILASHTSLVLAILGLALMITPNLMNPGFVVAFSAAFSLVVSVVLFLMNTTRKDSVAEGISIEVARIMNSRDFLDPLSSIDGSAEEVFTDNAEEANDSDIRSDCFDDSKKENVSEESVSEEGNSTERVSEEYYLKEGTSGERILEEHDSKEGSSGERVSEEHDSKEGISRRRVSEDQDLKEGISRERVSKEHDLEEVIPRERVSEEYVLKEGISRERVSEERVSDANVFKETNVSGDKYDSKNKNLEIQTDAMIRELIEQAKILRSCGEHLFSNGISKFNSKEA